MVDAGTLTAMMEAQFDTLYWLSYNLLRSQADAQDAVQQGMLKAWAHRATVRPEHLRAWLARIVINECHNIHRHRQRVAPSDTVAPAQAFAAPDLDVQAAIAALPERLRIPFLLKYLGGYAEKEIAHTLRVPQSTVKNRLHRARGLLRQALADTEVDFQ